jgi:hypothetical protein
LQPAHLALNKREQLIADAVLMKRAIGLHDQAGLIDCFH